MGVADRGAFELFGEQMREKTLRRRVAHWIGEARQWHAVAIELDKKYLGSEQRWIDERWRGGELAEALESIANDFDDWGDTIARYTMSNVARNALDAYRGDE